MMSDLPGEITKQIFTAPPHIIRSTRYSLTARGLSVEPSMRLPTGSSSFENASGWILLPMPAAGMIPHINSYSSQSAVERGFELAATVVGGMLVQRALASGGADLLQLLAIHAGRFNYVFGGLRH